MAKLGTTNIGGGGGIGSDELTVTKNKVVEGYTYVGADTDDEIGDGIIPNKGSSTVSQSVTTSGSNLVTRIPNGAYITNASSGYPEITSSLSSVASVGGLTAAKLLSGQTALGISGTATNDGTVTANTIISGYVGYSKGVRIVGNVVVQSILSFSAAVYSSTAIAFTWQNPAKGPFSGVIIVGKTGAYPTSISDGTRYYKGSGNNTVASGTSSATVSSFTSGITYYFRAFSYAIKDGAEWVSATTYTATAATTRGQQSFASSGIFTIPAGVRSIDIFCVGGGGSGAGGYIINNYAGGGGGGGYTFTIKGVSVAPGQQLSISVGAGGAAVGGGYSGNPGSETKVISGSTTLASAQGGYGGSSSGNGGSGGSAGGRGAWVARNGGINAQNGASDGGSTNSSGQGTTTRAFGESGNTLYAGGGAGGGSGQYVNTNRGYGGDGGGGNGADAMGNVGSNGVSGCGGGGGGGYTFSTPGGGYAGGSGLCIIRWGY
ncbi:glycine-rich domain-containing protein [Lacrimispora indolis]|uniref:glycine-rich domain-containing protein n=1 Tax=Lacrimispora indolis TaxID=69825 RepID=UPI00040B85B7|nr:hypothetical protein [[Clostridium] methoxybenzovorans]